MTRMSRFGAVAAAAMSVALLAGLAGVSASAGTPTATSTSTSTSTSTTTEDSTTSTLADCFGPGPGSFTVDPHRLAPGQSVQLTGSGIWLVTAPNPSLCPLPVEYNGPVTVTLLLAPVGTADPPAEPLGVFDLVDGSMTSVAMIPAGTTYRGSAAVDFDVAGQFRADAPVTIVDPAAPSAPAAVASQPHFTG